ncbi:MAG: M28 family peptidase [Chloroflexota bacterium]
MTNNQRKYSFIFINLGLTIIFSGWGLWYNFLQEKIVLFNGDNAFHDVQVLVNLGPRIPNSEAHKKTIEYIQTELIKFNWNVTLLEQSINGHTAYNILATRSLLNPDLYLAAHYDSRIYADEDPDPGKRTTPVPGANDGASGVAVLLEIARSLPTNSIPTALLFIDIEDNGHIQGWDWIQGSRAYANQMTTKPKALILLDMIGDSDLNIYMERNSDVEITNQIWETAKNLGYESSFIQSFKYQVLDDHIPFLEKGIRSVDIIDLDYQYWHTTQDIPDKISAVSLQKVGSTILTWIAQYGPCLSTGKCQK